MGFQKVGEVLKFKDSGPSVEEARRAMFAAKEAPSGLSAKNAVAPPAPAPVQVPGPVVPSAPPITPVVTAVANELEPEFEEEIAPATPVVPAAPVVTTVPKVERVETPQFVGEIKQENGKWVAEIRYKTGAGTERFQASTKNELMLQLLAGKGHATMRVNKAVRREKLGWSELDRQYPLPEGITTEDFEKMSDKQQDHLLLTVATQQTLLFREAHPDFYRDPKNANAQKLSDFLGKERLPITLRNLEYAFDELTDSNLPAEVRLEERPTALVVEAPVTPSLSAPVAAPASVDSAPTLPTPAVAPATPIVPAAPAVTVRKRGTTGLRPGDSSSPTEPGPSEGGGEPRQLSEAELRKLPMSELKRIADADRRRASAQR
jgi:hypothetical protein